MLFAATFLACGLLGAQSAPPAEAGQGEPQASQITPTPAATQTANPASSGAAQPQKKTKLPTTNQRRDAAKLYMQAAQLYQASQFERAMDLDEKAAALDATNPDYKLGAEVARSHAVNALLQQAARDQIAGHPSDARAALAHGLDLDPQNATIAEHIRGLEDKAAASDPSADNDIQSLLKTPELAGPIELSPKQIKQNFHLHTSAKQVIQQVYSAYGIDATVDTSVRTERVRFDIDDAGFAEASRAVDLLCAAFYVPIDTHRVLVARDTNANRTQYERNAVATLPLSGLSTEDMTAMGNIARNVFEVRQMNVDASSGVLTIRGPAKTLDAFSATYLDLMKGRSEVLLDVRVLALAHKGTRNTGVQPLQTVSAFNIYAEEQSILSQNAALVQQIVDQGLAAPGDTLAIIGILLASGQVSSSLLQGGIVVFGGGITQSALVPGPFTANLSINSSDSRVLDNFSIRLEDGEEGTVKNGTRYPIITGSYGGGGGGINIPGLSTPGTSGSLGSILSSLQNSQATIPQFQYQDLGLTLKARPRVLRSGDIAMTVDLKISALAGASINDIPVLANREYSGAVTVPNEQAVVIAAEMDKSEMRAVSGWPGLSEIPGLNNATDKNVEKDSSTLLVILTPHVVRNGHTAGHTPMLPIEKSARNR
jgi:type II secretory pathway component GspD/PulD (secretin)